MEGASSSVKKEKKEKKNKFKIPAWSLWLGIFSGVLFSIILGTGLYLFAVGRINSRNNYLELDESSEIAVHALPQNQAPIPANAPFIANAQQIQAPPQVVQINAAARNLPPQGVNNPLIANAGGWTQQQTQQPPVQQTAQQTIQPLVQPLAQQPAQQPAQPLAQQPTQQPAQPLAQQPAQQPVQLSAQQIVQQPVQLTAQQPSQQTMQLTAQQPVQQPAQQIAQPPVQQPAQQIAQPPVQHPAQQFAQLTVQPPVQQPAQQIAQPPVQHPAQQFVQLTVQPPVQQPAQQIAQPPVQQPAQQIAQLTVQQPAQQFAQLPAQQTTQQPLLVQHFAQSPSQQTTPHVVYQPNENVTDQNKAMHYLPTPRGPVRVSSTKSQVSSLNLGGVPSGKKLLAGKTANTGTPTHSLPKAKPTVQSNTAQKPAPGHVVNQIPQNTMLNTSQPKEVPMTDSELEAVNQFMGTELPTKADPTALGSAKFEEARPNLEASPAKRPPVNATPPVQTGAPPVGTRVHNWMGTFGNTKPQANLNPIDTPVLATLPPVENPLSNVKKGTFKIVTPQATINPVSPPALGSVKFEEARSNLSATPANLPQANIHPAQPQVGAPPGNTTPQAVPKVPFVLSTEKVKDFKPALGTTTKGLSPANLQTVNLAQPKVTGQPNAPTGQPKVTGQPNAPTAQPKVTGQPNAPTGQPEPTGQNTATMWYNKILTVIPFRQQPKDIKPETNKPVAGHQLDNPGKTPTDPAKAPVSPAKAPVNIAKAPVNPAKAPVNIAKAPVSPAKAPVNIAKAHVSPAKAPTGIAKAPVNIAKTPTGIAKVSPGKVQGHVANPKQTPQIPIAQEHPTIVPKGKLPGPVAKKIPNRADDIKRSLDNNIETDYLKEIVPRIIANNQNYHTRVTLLSSHIDSNVNFRINQVKSAVNDNRAGVKFNISFFKEALKGAIVGSIVKYNIGKPQILRTKLGWNRELQSSGAEIKYEKCPLAYNLGNIVNKPEFSAAMDTIRDKIDLEIYLDTFKNSNAFKNCRQYVPPKTP